MRHSAQAPFSAAKMKIAAHFQLVSQGNYIEANAGESRGSGNAEYSVNYENKKGSNYIFCLLEQ